MIEGTTQAQPLSQNEQTTNILKSLADQADAPSKAPGITAPRMLPTDVCAFHTPMTVPRLI